MTSKANYVEPTTIAYFVLARSKDSFCDQTKQLAGTSNCLIIFDKNEPLTKQTTLHGLAHKLVPISLRSIILYVAHYPILAGHPGERRMYDSSCREYHWPNMSTEPYNTVRSCTDCPRVGTKFRHRRKIEFLPPGGPLGFVAIDILGPVSLIMSGKTITVIITVRYSDLTRAVSITKITSTGSPIFISTTFLPLKSFQTIYYLTIDSSL